MFNLLIIREVQDSAKYERVKLMVDGSKQPEEPEEPSNPDVV